MSGYGKCTYSPVGTIQWSVDKKNCLKCTACGVCWDEGLSSWSPHPNGGLPTPQSSVPQTSVSSHSLPSSEQYLPSPLGVGLSQDRLRVRLCCPQAPVQSDHEPHSPQVPSGECKQFWIPTYILFKLHRIIWVFGLLSPQANFGKRTWIPFSNKDL